jgi:TolA-binding protein
VFYAQNKIHTIELTELKGQFEYLNLRIDQVMEIQSLNTSVEQNAKDLREIKEFLSKQGFKNRKQQEDS